MGEGYEPIINDNDNEDTSAPPEVEVNGGNSTKPLDNGSRASVGTPPRVENGTPNDIGLQMEEVKCKDKMIFEML